ncbi:MAG TPA: hypothetical protein VJX23_00255 [Candidatus Binataceae bacterium]|nr:hypothetical protein [Candidatus Binataceae bacterium]
MKKVALVLLMSLLATGFALSTFTQAAHAQAPTAAQAGSNAGEEQPPPTTEPKHHHRSRGEVAITKTCGCQAECPEGYDPSEATSCYKEGVCKENGAKCTLTCKKGTDEKKIEGKCMAVYK